ncbi:unnamed protein product [Bursaphelenchus okinawaensis]|uniref:DNA primase n=1 Tax=Bursaphelenchus okinawaensis TaxID=465554 RepID=A0A811JWG6_9BILA|nr:unnamed protein product [Bursaphelenchus okinawaensis]CAG9085489.1 unnamed protein product [Bursaphelenchus okinawaensis]
MATQPFISELMDQYLMDYYNNLYPTKLFIKWLSYNKSAKEAMNKREIGFSFKGGAMLRYQSFSEPNEFTRTLCTKLPHKIEIGPVYNHPVSERLKLEPGAMKAVERELIFDIDLTDYDDVRNCCKDAKICQKCWLFMTIAAKVLQRILIEHFGFTNLLFVFSGRRGIHVWCADPAARGLADGDRRAIRDYFNVNDLKNTFRNGKIHMMIRDSCRTIMDSPETEELVDEQGWMDDDYLLNIWLKKCEDKATVKHVTTLFKKLFTSADRFKCLKQMCDPESHAESGTKLAAPSYEATKWFYTFLLHHMHPRLDEQVTLQVNHLLKSPFCVHPGTGLVSVPFKVEGSHEVQVEQFPRVDTLVQEVKNEKASKEEGNEDKENNRKILYYKRTSLAPYIEIFEEFIEKALQASDTNKMLN